MIIGAGEKIPGIPLWMKVEQCFYINWFVVFSMSMIMLISGLPFFFSFFSIYSWQCFATEVIRALRGHTIPEDVGSLLPGGFVGGFVHVVYFNNFI